MAKASVADGPRRRSSVLDPALAAGSVQSKLAYRVGSGGCGLFKRVDLSPDISPILPGFDVAGILYEPGRGAGRIGDIFYPVPDTARLGLEIDGKGFVAAEAAAEYQKLLESERRKTADGPAFLVHRGFSGF